MARFRSHAGAVTRLDTEGGVAGSPCWNVLGDPVAISAGMGERTDRGDIIKRV